MEIGMYLASVGRRHHPAFGRSVPMLQEGSVPYENTQPDTYASSVYSVPHWMISGEKYVKRSKVRLSMDSHVKIPKTKNTKPLLVDHMTLAIPSQVAESSVVMPDSKASRRLPVAAMAMREGTVPPGSALGSNKRTIKQEEDKTKRRRLAAHENHIASLLCNHCKWTFKAKPTYRSRFNHTLVNHSCLGSKRRQYVLGVKRRKCKYDCSSVQGCIYRIDS